jgi:endo-1,4-beta-xylanase
MIVNPIRRITRRSFLQLGFASAVSLTVPRMQRNTNPSVTETIRNLADLLGINFGFSSPMGYLQKWHPENAQWEPLFLQEANTYLSDWNFHWWNPYTALRPSRHEFDFSDTDLLVTYAEAHKMAIQAHHLLWSNFDHLPSWLTQGDFSKDELRTILQEHITEVVGRYRGRVQTWTVVNEYLGSPWDDGNGFWQDHLGPDYSWIELAFRTAREADPSAKLLLNDFGMEVPGSSGYYPERDNAIYDLVCSFKQQAVPLDGVGFQMHLLGKDFVTPEQISTLTSSLEQSIAKYQQVGVDVFVTEFDLRMNDVSGTTEQRFDVQARAYRALVDSCLNSGVKDLCIFGLIDRLSWLDDPDADPLLFDDNYVPKPSYYSVIQVLRGHVDDLYSNRLFLPLIAAGRRD